MDITTERNETINQTSGPGETVTKLSGRFDANECDEFDVYVDQLKTSGGTAESNLIFDLSAVDFIDSTALASLVALSKWAAANGRKMEVRNPSNPVRIILELTALDRVLNVTDQPVRQ